MSSLINPYNYLKSELRGGGKTLLTANFAHKLLKVLSADRVYFDRAVKDSPGQDGRLVEIIQGASGLSVPFTVTWANGTATITHNGGTVTWFKSAAVEDQIWRPGGKTTKLSVPDGGYVWIEYIHAGMSFSFRAGYGRPSPMDFTDDGDLIQSTVIIAHIVDKAAVQMTFYSFMLSPCFKDAKPGLDFAAYHSRPD